MRYVIASKARSVQKGISLIGHKVGRDRILLNEREIQINASLSGSFEERVTELDGIIYSETEVINLLKQEDWNNE